MTHTASEKPLPSDSLMSGLALILAAGMAQMLVVIDYTATAIALPRMASDFNVSADSLQWVLTGYILSFSIVLAIAGPLGDRFGRKRLLLLGIVLFGAVSVWVGMANSVMELIVSRVALGVGAGLLFPLSTAVVGAAMPQSQLPRTMSILTGVATLGMAIGPVVGGVFTELIDWRWVFLINPPISAVAFILMFFLSKESRNPEAARGRLDFIGIILLTLGIGGLSIGVAGLSDHALPTSISIIVGSVFTLLLFVWHELRQDAPIVDLRLLGNRTFAGYLTGGSLSNACWCVLIFTTTLYLQEVQKEDPMTAGFHFLYLSVPVAAAGFLGPFLQRRIGTRLMLLFATAIQTAACVIFWMSDVSPWLAIGLLVVGFGCSWGWSMSQAGGIATIPERNVGLASGSMLTVIIMSGNIAVVVSATMIKGMGGANMVDYAPGVTASYLLALGLAAAGFVASAIVIPRQTTIGS
ncbi:MAG: MFS transporter [Phycisphaerales bacterium]|nr:MFS transporter [Phycisphaerales bacterium]